MKKNSTLSYLLDKSPHLETNKTNKTNKRFKVKEHIIQTILSYSKSVKCIKTRSVGDVLLINN